MKRYRWTRNIIGILFCILWIMPGVSQISIRINSDQQDVLSSEVFRIQNEYPDSLSAYSEIKEQIRKLRSAGYLTASLDSFVVKDSVCIAGIFVGNQYKAARLKFQPTDAWLTEEMQLNMNKFENQYWAPERFAAMMDDILFEMANHGYPFAKIKLDSIVVDQSTISASIFLDRNELIYYDTLSLTGDVHVSKSFLSNYLGIRSGKEYRHSDILSINQKIANLGFMELRVDPIIEFFQDKAVIKLDLINKRNSRFDFLFGIQPNTVDGNQKIGFAFDFTTEMHNKLGLGEYFYLQLSRLKTETQELQLNFKYPYILDLPFGLDVDLNIFRNSNQYLDVDFGIGWQYFISGIDYLKAYWRIKSSRLLDIDAAKLLNSAHLPSQLDIRYSAGGLEFNLERLDYKFNPQRGIRINTRTTVGLKDILKNSEIESVKNEFIDFTNSYDSLNLESFQLQIEGSIDYFIPLGERTALRTALQSAIIISEEPLYENELFRIGGNQILRGFDEKSVFSDFYNTLTGEFRLLIGQNSFISMFVDYAFVRNRLLDKPWDQMMGMGAGLSFETQVGIFGISTAVGRRRDVPFNFKTAKVHFGFLSLF